MFKKIELMNIIPLTCHNNINFDNFAIQNIFTMNNSY
jgi:hypothetical protein